MQYELDEGTSQMELPGDVATGLRDSLNPANFHFDTTTSNGALHRKQPQMIPRQSSNAKSGNLDSGAIEDELKKIAGTIASCTKCSLHKTRTRVVPGQGAFNPEIMFVGEAPGEDEDRQGLAFVGRAGQLLTKMIQAMGYERDEVFIANVLKCRPPNNRQPMPDEMETCMPYLKAQIGLLKPKVIVTLGGTAVKALFNSPVGITRLRGTWMSFEGIDVMPTYHPAYLLRNPPAKKEVWVDLQEVLKRLGRKPPARPTPQK